MTDTVEKTQIKLYFPPEMACCTKDYKNMPSQEFKVMAEVSKAKKITRRFTIMDIEPIEGRFMFSYQNLTKSKKKALKIAIFNATCDALGIQPKSKSLSQAVPEVLFE